MQKKLITPPIIENKNQLVAFLESGSKPKEQWRIGTELEMFGFALPSSKQKPFSPPPYQPDGIEALFKSFIGENWQPILDKSPESPMIGLQGINQDKHHAISLEPGGQVELSGAPLKNIFETEKELSAYFKILHQKASALGYGFAPLGFQPLAKLEEMPWMPKIIYKIQKNYYQKRQAAGICESDLNTMPRTCTGQVNLDFSSEKDMSLKMRVALKLQPAVMALFANSPFYEGKISNWQSVRGKFLLQGDQNRFGQPEIFFEENFSFEKYIDWILKVPMNALLSDGIIHPISEEVSFLDWIEGKSKNPLLKRRPTIADFENHLGSVYPDVRLKTFLEMRGADAGSPAMMLALPAFWTGILYTQDILEEVDRRLKTYPFGAFQVLREKAPKYGIRAPFPKDFPKFLQEICELAVTGLQKRGLGEETFLTPLLEILEKQETQSDYWIKAFNEKWQGNLSALFLQASI